MESLNCSFAFFTITGCRSLDTRLSAPIPAAGTLTVTLAGTCGIPTTATAVAVNAVVTEPVTGGSITLYAGDQALPPVSTLNFSTGQTRANNAVVSLASDGSGTIKVRNQSGGTIQLILDVTGYFQ